MAVLKIYYEKTAGMDYLYKITVEIDDEKVLSLQQHDLDAVYKTVREAFAMTALRICSEKYKNLTTNTANKFNGEHYENRTCA